ncbi:hypothetical protein [Porphyromonas macacae]|uniref:hypothetical protein n=1 Tax=Porphyromonas macacae TaxID=28115 RepID=UPI0024ACA765|nr:hypothetical protein [Porphyromonas macacae]
MVTIRMDDIQRRVYCEYPGRTQSNVFGGCAPPSLIELYTMKFPAREKRVFMTFLFLLTCTENTAARWLEIFSAMDFYSLPEEFSTKLTWIFIFLNKIFEPSGDINTLSI